MSEELRIRDTRAAKMQRGGAGEGASPTRRNARFDDDEPGEVAWDLAEPLYESPPPSGEHPSGDEQKADAPPPFPMFPGMGGDEEEAPKGPGIDILRLVRGILKRLWLAAGIAFVIAVAFLAAAVTLVEHQWQAAAVVMIHSRQDEFSLGTATPFESQDYNLKTMLDTVKLPSSLQAVADALKLEVPRRALSASIGVRISKDSNLFQLTAIWEDPVTAAKVANEVAEQLVQRSRGLRHKDAANTYADYTAQLEAARRELDVISEEMRAFKDAHKIADFSAQPRVLLGNLVQLETDLAGEIGKTQAMREVLADVEQAIGNEPDMVVASTVYRNPLKSRLTDYEWQLQEARSRYTEQNPKVIKLKTRVDVLQQMIDETQDEGAPENLYSANTKLLDLQKRQRELKSDIRIHDAQIAALSETIEKTRAELAVLTAAEKDYQLLQQRLTSAENLEANLAGRVEEAKVVMLRNEAAFELFEPAFPPTEPLPSKKKLIAVAGVFLGGMAGLFVVVLLELLDPFVRTRRDVLGVAGAELGWELRQVSRRDERIVDAAAPGDPVAVFFRRLINDLDAKLDPDDWACLGVTSADEKAGRTLVAANLAQILAIKEHPVVLVDADLRRVAGTRLADLLEIPPDRPGLLQALRGQDPISAVLCDTTTPGLSLVPAGAFDFEPDQGPVPGAAEPADFESALTCQPREPELSQLGSRRFRAVSDALRQSGRHLVYDLPPVGTHETVLEAAVDLRNLILVARSGQTTRGQLRDTVQQLEDRGVNVRGVLITAVPEDLAGDALFPQLKRWRRWLRRLARLPFSKRRA